MENNKDIEKEIISKIEKGELKMKPRWFFLAQKKALILGFILILLGVIFLLNTLFYYFKTNRFLIGPHCGWAAWQDLFYGLPYDLIVIIIVLLVLFNWIVKKFDFSYKNPFLLVFSGFLIFIIALAVVIFTTSLNDLIRQDFQKTDINIPYFKNLYINRCCHDQECPMNK